MKHHSKIFLDRDFIEDLQKAVADLERRADNTIEHAVYRDYDCVNRSLEVRERIFQLLALVAGLEEDLSKRVRIIIAEYLEQIYAFHAKLEEDMEALENASGKSLGDDSVF